MSPSASNKIKLSLHSAVPGHQYLLPETGQGHQYGFLRPDRPAALVRTHVHVQVKQLRGTVSLQLGVRLQRGLQPRHPSEHHQQVGEGWQAGGGQTDALLTGAEGDVVASLVGARGEYGGEGGGQPGGLERGTDLPHTWWCSPSRAPPLSWAR